MPFCPTCKMEYLSGYSKCPDCSEMLVDHLPDEKPAPEVRFVPLPNLPGRVYAEMVKNVLEKKGIPCYIHSEGFSEAYGRNAASGVGTTATLYGPEDRLEECLALQHDMLDHI